MVEETNGGKAEEGSNFKPCTKKQEVQRKER